MSFHKFFVFFRIEVASFFSKSWSDDDLIGLKVFADGEEIGEVVDVFKTGANDVYTVKTTQGKEAYIPAVRDFINNIDIENGKIEINLLEGLLD